jgi:hypothetical protein
VQNQIDNCSNSKQERPPAAAGRIVAAVVAAVALAVLGAALIMPQPLSGRLHPAHFPAAVALLALAAVVACLRHSHASGQTAELACQPDAPASTRGILCAIGAVIILALGTRSLGLLPAVSAAGALAALGIHGASVSRAAIVGAGLAAVSASLFVAVLRLPLPLLPGHW